MRLLIVVLALVCLSTAFKSKNPLKTKKYKCIELAEDEEVRIVSKKGYRSYSHESERPMKTVSREASSESETIEVPQARKNFGLNMRPIPATTMTPPTPPANYPSDVKKDKQGRPLILSPEHCEKMKKYSAGYGVSDVRAYVHDHCSMAQMFLPGASCEEINILVGSCYRNKFL